jgi:hypothetical protein
MANYSRDFLVKLHPDYERKMNDWNFHYRSYLGGQDYENGYFLHRYILETEEEYLKRAEFTPLDNHCRNVIQIYSSFLFRVPPTRNFGSLTGDPQLQQFLMDADFDGRQCTTMLSEKHRSMLLSMVLVG